MAEFDRVAGVFAAVGVNRLRLAGGEPLLRPELEDLVAAPAARGAFKDVALTTNGVLLARRCEGLRAAGLTRVTVSLDTLDRGGFRRSTGGASTRAFWKASRPRCGRALPDR